MTVLAPIEDRKLAAIGLVVAALLGFSGIDTCAKWLVLHGMATPEVVFVRYFGHLALVMGLALPFGERILRTRNLGTILLRGGLLLMSTALNFTALFYLPLTLTSAIGFSAPLWICLLSIPILDERVGRRRWAAILVGFCGILVVTRPWTGSMHWAVALSMAAALCGALYSILTRLLAGRDSTATQQFYAALIATLGTAPFAFADWSWPQQASSWLAFVMIGIFGWLGHQLVIIAHRFAPASVLAPFVYVQILYMAASSWLIFGQPPDVWVIVGAGIVGASGLYIWLRERALAATPIVSRGDPLQSAGKIRRKNS